METNLQENGWDFELLAEIDDADDDNVDVSVTLADGSRYSATFFSVKNIETLLNRYQKTGECLKGLYLWSSHMIIVRILSHEEIRAVISDMLKNGEFHTAFGGPY